MTIYGSEVRSRAADMFERGLGRESVAAELGISPNTVRKWHDTFRAVGREVLLGMGSKRKYDWETKVSAARAVVDGGMAKPEAMRRFGIASGSPLDAWCRKYREGGAEALRPKPKGRPAGAAKSAPKPPTREEELEERVRKLKAENAYLKKLAALRAEETLRTGSRPRW